MSKNEYRNLKVNDLNRYYLALDLLKNKECLIRLQKKLDEANKESRKKFNNAMSK